MAHPVVEGPVTLVKCVTPGAYWIRCADCVGSCTIPTSIERQPYSGEYYPPQGALVFVRDSSDGHFYRGIVRGRRNCPRTPRWKYVVQLVDTFQIDDFPPEDVYPSFGSTSCACASAHLVSLSHVLPSPVVDFGDENELKSLNASARQWKSKTVVVEDFLRVATKITYEQLSIIDGSVYCKLTASGSYFSNVNLSDFVARERVGFITDHCFKEMIQILMRPVKVPGLLPTFDPKLGLTNEEDDYSLDKVEYDFTQFRVLDSDKELHKSISRPFSINVIFTNQPSKDDILIRFVAPDGCVFVGTVINVPVHFYDIPECQTPDFRPSAVLEPCNLKKINGLVKNLDLSVEDSEEESSNKLLLYNYREAVHKFIQEGGIIDNHYPISALHQKFKLAANFVKMSCNSLQITELKNWQKVCLPSLLNRNDAVLVGPPSQGKLTMTLISVLSSMKVEGCGGPTCIVLAPNHVRADHAASIVMRLSDCKMLLSTSSFVSDVQKSEMSAGCDLLVASPTNVMQLVDDRCCHLGRLSHVVYDSFESLVDHGVSLKRFDDVVRHKSPDVQIVYLSNIWTSRILDYARAPYTRCLTDLVEATFYRAVAPSLILTTVDDASAHLVDVLRTRKSGKKIILCHNDDELSSIEDALTHTNNVFVISDSSDKDSASMTIKSWENRRNSLLICCDGAFRKYNVTNDADLLISWRARNRDTLNKRFVAITDENNLDQKKKIEVLLFCNRDNYEELLFMSELLPNEDLEQYLDAVFVVNERKKICRICSELLMFGKCHKKFKCNRRHVFLNKDSLLRTSRNQFLLGTLLEVHSAFHFSFRVEKVVGNQSSTDNLSGLVSSSGEIEEALEIAYRHRRMSIDNDTFRVGDIAGAAIFVNGKRVLRRVKIISMDSYVVKMLDFVERPSSINFEDLFVIPGIVASLPRDFVQVYVSGLMPMDYKSDFAYETKYFVHNLIDLFEDKGIGGFLVGTVYAVVNRSVIVDSVRLTKSEQDVTLECVSLKESIVEIGLAKKNVDHLKTLSTLAVKCGKCTLVANDLIERFGHRHHLPIEFSSCTVTAFDHPGIFYVQLDDEKEKLAELESQLSLLTNPDRRLLYVAVDELCAVCGEDGSWSRAIVVCVDSDSPTPVTVMCVDHGDTRFVRVEDLFELPEEFVDVPYFAVECQLSGVKPANGDNWSDGAARLFEKCVRNDDNTMRSLVVKFQGEVKNDGLERYYNRHQVLIKLAETPDGVSVNFRLVGRGLASWDLNSRHLITNTSKGMQN